MGPNRDTLVSRYCHAIELVVHTGKQQRVESDDLPEDTKNGDLMYAFERAKKICNSRGLVSATFWGPKNPDNVLFVKPAPSPEEREAIAAARQFRIATGLRDRTFKKRLRREKYEAMQAMIDAGRSKEEVALHFGVSASTVSNHTRPRKLRRFADDLFAIQEALKLMQPR